MKKNLLVIILLAVIFTSNAQEPADALGYSWYVPGGSARTQAVGGAMGSLGGDVTATFVNPAGLAFYKTGDFILSPVYQFQKTKANYLNTNAKEDLNKLTWGTSGVVLGTGFANKKVRSVAVSLAYNRTANFNSTVVYRGQNNKSSFSQKFAEELKNSGIKDNSIEYEFPLGASLIYNTHWIDTVLNSSGQIVDFVTNAPVNTGLLQQHTIKNKGAMHEFALGVAVNLRDNLMLGASLGVPVIDHKRETEFLEADASSNTNNQFDYGLFSDKLKVSGAGINLKAGLIYKPKEFWRLGLSLHTPSMLMITERYEAAVVLNDDVPDEMSWTDESKRYTNDQPSEFKYILITPYRVIGSVSYVLREIQDVTKQRGFLTADIEYVNHKASSYQPDEDNENEGSTKAYLEGLNRAIDNAYQGSLNFRVGGELKFTTIMVRAGASYYGNPYKNINGEKGSKLNFSGGLGYRNKGFFIDLTYVHSINKDVHFPYRLNDKSLYSGANLKTTAGNVFATIGLKF